MRRAMRSIVRRRRGGVQLSRRAPVLQKSRLSFARTVQFHVYSFEHGVQIVGYLRIPEADDSVPLPLQPKLPFQVALGCLIVVMVSAIKFDNEPPTGAEEIHDIRSDGRLTPEVRPINREFS